MTMEDVLDRRFPLVIVLALLLQAATAVWWAATKDSDDRFQQQRIGNLEQAVSQTKEGQILVLERLARIEERQNVQIYALDRISKQLGSRP